MFHSSSVLFTGDEIKSALLIVHSGPYPSCDVTNFVFNFIIINRSLSVTAFLTWPAEYLDALVKSFSKRINYLA